MAAAGAKTAKNAFSETPTDCARPNADPATQYGEDGSNGSEGSAALYRAWRYSFTGWG
jgi:hypothetical protein